MIRSMRTLALLLPLAGVLAGCQVTALQRAPTGATGECPKELRGAWIALDDQGREESDFGVWVHDDCGVESREKGKARPAQQPLPHLATFAGNGRPYVMVTVADARTLLGEETRDEQMPDDALLFFRWSRDEQLLTLQQPDHRRVATLVVQGAVPGRVRWENNGGSSLLTGDADQIADALRRMDLVDDGEALRFKRVGDDGRALDRAIKRAAAARTGSQKKR